MREKQRAVASAFYEMGQALRRLAAHDVIAALGYATFGALLAAEVELSSTQAERLMLIATQIAESDAVRWKQDKSFAVADLMRQDGVRALSRRRLELPSKQVIDLDRTSTAVLLREAESVRHARQPSGSSRRGRTTTPEERHAAVELARALGALGVAATARCVATKPGQPSDVALRFSVAHADAVLARLRRR